MRPCEQEARLSAGGTNDDVVAVALDHPHVVFELPEAECSIRIRRLLNELGDARRIGLPAVPHCLHPPDKGILGPVDRLTDTAARGPVTGVGDGLEREELMTFGVVGQPDTACLDVGKAGCVEQLGDLVDRELDRVLRLQPLACGRDSSIRTRGRAAL
jgi:hypothetical protein